LGRILRLVVFSAAFMAVQPAFADKPDKPDKPEQEHGDGKDKDKDKHQVPELSTNGAAAGFALIAGGAAIVLGRRRRR
jgi:LPXTG-motif cell wall-anchored protein